MAELVIDGAEGEILTGRHANSSMILYSPTIKSRSVLFQKLREFWRTSLPQVSPSFSAGGP